MERYDEEALKQEVIYLHSLWRRGPPTRNGDPTRIIQNLDPDLNPRSRPRTNYIPPSDLFGSRGPIRTHLSLRQESPSSHHPYNRSLPRREYPRSSPEWPVTNLSYSNPSGSRSSRNPRSDSASSQSFISSSVNLHKDVLQSCNEFLSGKTKFGEEDDGGDEDYLLESDGIEGMNEFKFFSRLFGDNDDLRDFYEKNYASGEFHCLVCDGIEARIGRRFMSCLAVVQHSIAIHKTETMSAHRAFAQVVCNILGWDINNPAAGSSKETQETGASTSGNVEWQDWPLKPPEASETIALSEEERARVAILHIQKKASEAFKEFLAEASETDNESDEEEDDDPDFDEDVSESEESKESKFFFKVFSENNDLRSYYEKNYESGEFVCLVCVGMGKKVLKRFKDCSGLLQHSTKLLNTNKKRAHRAFARVVCKVFGWDFDRLPLIAGKDPVSKDGTSTNTDANESGSLNVS